MLEDPNIFFVEGDKASSHNWPTDNKEALCRSLNTCAVAAVGDNCGIGSEPDCEECISTVW